MPEQKHNFCPSQGDAPGEIFALASPVIHSCGDV
jgi:hypothetical protein